MSTTLAPLDPELMNVADADPVRRELVGRMKSATLSLDDARRVRDQKMQQVLDHAEREQPKWGDLALAYLKRYAETHDRFAGWHVTHAAELTRSVPTPPTLKSWGSLFTKAQRLGWIEKCGFTQDKNRHCNPIPVYRSLIMRAVTAGNREALRPAFGFSGGST